MMTASDWRSAAVLAAVSLCCLAYGQHGEVFDRHRGEILSGQISYAEGFYYGVAEIAPCSDSSPAMLAAKGHCGLAAAGSLVGRIALSDIRWPETISEDSRRALVRAMTDRIAVDTTVRHMTDVYRKFDSKKKCWVSVKSLARDDADAIPRCTYADVRRRLLVPEIILYSGVPVSALCELRAADAPMPEAQDMRAWTKLLGTERRSPMAAAVARVAGRYPIGTLASPTDAHYREGMAAFSRGALRGAYGCFLKSLHAGMTFDALNMAGNVGRRIGEERDAAVLLLHAAYLNPKSPFPWIHLAHIARSLGDEALKETCCGKAEPFAEDMWSKTQIALLRKPPVPPASEMYPAAKPVASVAKPAVPAAKPAAVPAAKPAAKSVDSPARADPSEPELGTGANYIRL